MDLSKANQITQPFQADISQYNFDII